MGIATKGKQGQIDHVKLLMDKSGSMQRHRFSVPKVVDGMVANMANKASATPDQETRVSVYAFDDKVECLYYDKDVLRLPSIKDLYQIGGMTGMIDAMELAIEDALAEPQRYGDHANLLVLFTDGHESERPYDWPKIQAKINELPDNFTVAALVPGEAEKRQVMKYGVPEGNIAIWDAQAADGVERAGAMMAQATTAYSAMRAQGVRSTTTLFSTSAAVLNAENLKAVGAQRLTGNFQLVTARNTPEKMKTEDFAHSLGLEYVNGSIYYQLIKREKIQGHKGLLAQNRKTKEIFYGDGIRALVGLGSGEQSVAPDFNKEWALFVQSTANNRHVVEFQEFVIMNPVQRRR